MSEAVAVLGAGNGGCAAAADLTLRAFDVRLFNRTAERLAPVRERGGVETRGVLGEQFVALDQVTTDLAEAVAGVSAVVLTVPISGLQFYAEQLPPLLEPDQAVMLNPGHMGGGLFFSAE